jgi:hypothetical protein
VMLLSKRPQVQEKSNEKQVLTKIA